MPPMSWPSKCHSCLAVWIRKVVIRWSGALAQAACEEVPRLAEQFVQRRPPGPVPEGAEGLEYPLGVLGRLVAGRGDHRPDAAGPGGPQWPQVHAGAAADRGGIRDRSVPRDRPRVKGHVVV